MRQRMWRKLFDQISEALTATDGDADDESRDEAIRHATAVLMIDVALADKSFDDEELQRILEHARSRFGLDDKQASDLIRSARADAENIVSIHDFTQLLHNNLTAPEKEAVVGTLWQIAYADGDLDKYENSLVLKISDGLHVSRGRCMKLKHDAYADGI